MKDLHFIAKLYDPKTGDYVGKFDLVANEIVDVAVTAEETKELEQSK